MLTTQVPHLFQYTLHHGKSPRCRLRIQIARNICLALFHGPSFILAWACSATCQSRNFQQNDIAVPHGRTTERALGLGVSSWGKAPWPPFVLASLSHLWPSCPPRSPSPPPFATPGDLPSNLQRTWCALNLPPNYQRMAFDNPRFSIFAPHCPAQEMSLLHQSWTRTVQAGSVGGYKPCAPLSGLKGFR